MANDIDDGEDTPNGVATSRIPRVKSGALPHSYLRDYKDKRDKKSEAKYNKKLQSTLGDLSTSMQKQRMEKMRGGSSVSGTMIGANAGKISSSERSVSIQNKKMATSINQGLTAVQASTTELRDTAQILSDSVETNEKLNKRLVSKLERAITALERTAVTTAKVITKPPVWAAKKGAAAIKESEHAKYLDEMVGETKSAGKHQALNLLFGMNPVLAALGTGALSQGIKAGGFAKGKFQDWRQNKKMQKEMSNVAIKHMGGVIIAHDGVMVQPKKGKARPLSKKEKVAVLREGETVLPTHERNFMDRFTRKIADSFILATEIQTKKMNGSPALTKKEPILYTSNKEFFRQMGETMGGGRGGMGKPTPKEEPRDWYEKLKGFGKQGWGSFYAGGLLRMKKEKKMDYDPLIYKSVKKAIEDTGGGMGGGGGVGVGGGKSRRKFGGMIGKYQAKHTPEARRDLEISELLSGKKSTGRQISSKIHSALYGRPKYMKWGKDQVKSMILDDGAAMKAAMKGKLTRAGDIAKKSHAWAKKKLAKTAWTEEEEDAFQEEPPKKNAIKSAWESMKNRMAKEEEAAKGSTVRGGIVTPENTALIERLNLLIKINQTTSKGIGGLRKDSGWQINKKKKEEKAGIWEKTFGKKKEKGTGTDIGALLGKYSFGAIAGLILPMLASAIFGGEGSVLSAGKGTLIGAIAGAILGIPGGIPGMLLGVGAGSMIGGMMGGFKKESLDQVMGFVTENNTGVLYGTIIGGTLGLMFGPLGFAFGAAAGAFIGGKAEQIYKKMDEGKRGKIEPYLKEMGLGNLGKKENLYGAGIGAMLGLLLMGPAGMIFGGLAGSFLGGAVRQIKVDDKNAFAVKAKQIFGVVKEYKKEAAAGAAIGGLLGLVLSGFNPAIAALGAGAGATIGTYFATKGVDENGAKKTWLDTMISDKEGAAIGGAVGGIIGLMIGGPAFGMVGAALGATLIPQLKEHAGIDVAGSVKKYIGSVASYPVGMLGYAAAGAAVGLMVGGPPGAFLGAAAMTYIAEKIIGPEEAQKKIENLWGIFKEKKEKLIGGGAIGGALGLILFGPPGAMVGAAAGSFLTGTLGDEKKTGYTGWVGRLLEGGTEAAIKHPYIVGIPTLAGAVIGGLLAGVYGGANPIMMRIGIGAGALVGGAIGVGVSKWEDMFPGSAAITGIGALAGAVIGGVLVGAGTFGVGLPVGIAIGAGIGGMVGAAVGGIGSYLDKSFPSLKPAWDTIKTAGTGAMVGAALGGLLGLAGGGVMAVPGIVLGAKIGAAAGAVVGATGLGLEDAFSGLKVVWNIVKGAGIGAMAGGTAGAIIGGLLGLPAGGFGFLPGAMIGATIGMTIGGAVGTAVSAGKEIWDMAWGNKPVSPSTGAFLFTVAGGLIGGMIGGPPGVAVGAAIGGMIGSKYKEWAKEYEARTKAASEYAGSKSVDVRNKDISRRAQQKMETEKPGSYDAWKAETARRVRKENVKVQQLDKISESFRKDIEKEEKSFLGGNESRIAELKMQQTQIEEQKSRIIQNQLNTAEASYLDTGATEVNPNSAIAKPKAEGEESGPKGSMFEGLNETKGPGGGPEEVSAGKPNFGSMSDVLTGNVIPPAPSFSMGPKPGVGPALPAPLPPKTDLKGLIASASPKALELWGKAKEFGTKTYGAVSHQVNRQIERRTGKKLPGDEGYRAPTTGGIWGSITGSLQTFWNFIKSIFGGVMDTTNVDSIFNKINGTVSEYGGKAYDYASQKASELGTEASAKASKGMAFIAGKKILPSYDSLFKAGSDIKGQNWQIVQDMIAGNLQSEGTLDASTADSRIKSTWPAMMDKTLTALTSPIAEKMGSYRTAAFLDMFYTDPNFDPKSLGTDFLGRVQKGDWEGAAMALLDTDYAAKYGNRAITQAQLLYTGENSYKSGAPNILEHANTSFSQMAGNVGNVVKGTIMNLPKTLTALVERSETGGIPNPEAYMQKDTNGLMSYGMFQFNGTGADKVVLGSPWASEFTGLKSGTSDFNAKWKEIAAREPQKFADYQRQAAINMWYKPYADRLQGMGIDVTKAPLGIQGLLMSTAIQFGKGTDVLDGVLMRGKDALMNAPESIIQGITEARTSRWPGTAKRYMDEKMAALGMIKDKVSASLSGAGEYLADTSIGKGLGKIASSVKERLGGISWPPSTGNISSAFGPRIHPVTGQPDDHPGIDIATPVRSAVSAISEGIAHLRNNPGGYGKYMTISHPSGLTSLYGHLSEALVGEGEKVSAGQQIAKSGGAKGDPNAGSSSGPHLHFGLMEGNSFTNWLNPLAAGGPSKGFSGGAGDNTWKVTKNESRQVPATPSNEGWNVLRSESKQIPTDTSTGATPTDNAWKVTKNESRQIPSSTDWKVIRKESKRVPTTMHSLPQAKLDVHAGIQKLLASGRQAIPQELLPQTSLSDVVTTQANDALTKGKTAAASSARHFQQLGDQMSASSKNLGNTFINASRAIVQNTSNGSSSVQGGQTNSTGMDSEIQQLAKLLLKGYDPAEYS